MELKGCRTMRSLRYQKQAEAPQKKRRGKGGGGVQEEEEKCAVYLQH